MNLGKNKNIENPLGKTYEGKTYELKSLNRRDIESF